MIIITKRHLCVHTCNKELEVISKSSLKNLFLKMPANIAYFETPERLYGIVTFGDILKSKSENVIINKNFISLARNEYMKAREYFKNSVTICEIPIVENGQLAGEFHKFDDELILDRARGYEYNAYSELYFSKLGNVALVKPVATREYKLQYFNKMRSTLDRYHVNYQIIDFADIMAKINNYDMFMVVDEQERRGAQILIDLYEKKPHLFYKVVTYFGIQTKLDSSEVMDYEQTLQEFVDKGVDVILLTANYNKSAYALKVDREMKDRFPYLTNNLNALMKPYEEQFFDDLYENKDYVENIENGYFVVEKDKENLRLQDITSKYINVKRGERLTVEQPDEYTRTIFFFGPCLIIGSYVGDEYTIESYMQKMINAKGYKVRVVNCGCWGGNVSSISRMVSTLISEGDIIVALLENLNINDEKIKKVDLWETIEKYRIPSEWMLDMPVHVNHHVSEIYAKAIFDKIFTSSYKDKEKKSSFITQNLNVIDKFFIKKYFDGVKLDGFARTSCSVINGNPFTNGHRYLIETASKKMDHVYLLSVQENSSIFSYGERYAMAVEAVRSLPNVTVIPSGLFLGNMTIFPAYYAKIYMGNTAEQAQAHVEAYASVARLLHVTHRYIGQEPVDHISNEINIACKKILPKFNIQTVILNRKEENGKMITGTFVRELACNDDPELDKYVPKSTADIIRCESINVF